MRILGIDSAIPEASVALVENSALLAEERHSAANGSAIGKLPSNHSEILLPLIHSLLEKTGTRIQQLAAIAVSIGPGSFTGLRIALATAKGLAYESGVPLVGVSTLHANVARIAKSDGLFGSMLDARKGEVYFAPFRRAGDNLTRLADDAVLALEPAIDILRDLGAASGELVLVGNGAKIHERWLTDSLGSIRIVSGLCGSSIAAAVAKLGGEQVDAAKIDEGCSLAPVYLRQPEAELRRKNFLLTR
jgi:tRNA threonylcarbamoyladenosine biosynthesis protein TsaB